MNLVSDSSATGGNVADSYARGSSITSPGLKWLHSDRSPLDSAPCLVETDVELDVRHCSAEAAITRSPPPDVAPIRQPATAHSTTRMLEKTDNPADGPNP